MDISKYPCIILSVRYLTNKRAIDAKQVPTAKVGVVIVTQEDTNWLILTHVNYLIFTCA